MHCPCKIHNYPPAKFTSVHLICSYSLFRFKNKLKLLVNFSYRIIAARHCGLIRLFIRFEFMFTCDHFNGKIAKVLRTGEFQAECFELLMHFAKCKSFLTRRGATTTVPRGWRAGRLVSVATTGTRCMRIRGDLPLTFSL